MSHHVLGPAHMSSEKSYLSDVEIDGIRQFSERKLREL